MKEFTRKRFDKAIANPVDNVCHINRRLMQTTLKEFDEQTAYVAELEKELFNYRDAAEFCRETKRSITSSAGWTMLCKSYYMDLVCEVESFRAEVKDKQWE